MIDAGNAKECAEKGLIWRVQVRYKYQNYALHCDNLDTAIWFFELNTPHKNNHMYAALEDEFTGNIVWFLTSKYGAIKGRPWGQNNDLRREKQDREFIEWCKENHKQGF